MRRRLRRFILAAGTTLCVLIALAFVVSAWWFLEAGTGVNRFTLPLIYPFAAVAVPTLLVWRFGRKRVNPGHCPCGYDLTGNVSGTCPECGKGM